MIVLLFVFTLSVAADHASVSDCLVDPAAHPDTTVLVEREWVGAPPEHVELDSSFCNIERRTLEQWRSFSADIPVIIPSMGNEKFTSIVSRSNILGEL